MTSIDGVKVNWISDNNVLIIFNDDKTMSFTAENLEKAKKDFLKYERLMVAGDVIVIMQNVKLVVFRE